MKTKQFLCMLLISVITIVGLTLAACKPDNEEELIPPGAETGQYYYEYEGNDYSITLNSGDKFSLYVPDANKSGTYRLEEDSLVLSFYLEEEQTERESLTAKLQDETITLTYQNSQLTFYKKLVRKVAFDTRGATEIPNTTVVNGRFLSRPENPTYDGYDLEGWYTNESYTTPFMFETQRVTSDLKLYALWVARSASSTEFKIDFDINTEGENPASVQTSGGRIFSLPEQPTRTGYVFKGWWISYYDDGDKLSVKVPDDNPQDFMFKENTTLYSYWQSIPTQSNLAQPVVRVEGDDIIWEGVSGAINYDVQVLKVEQESAIEIDSSNLTDLLYKVSFSNLDAGDYIIKLTANAVVVDESSESVVYYKNKALTRVSHFAVLQPSILSFNEITEATEYLINVDCGNELINLTSFNNGKTTLFNFARFPMPENGITFTVTTSAEGRASTSRQYTYNRMLGKITEFYFDEETETLSWDKVDNATNYIVSILSDSSLPMHELINNSNKTSYNLKDHSGEITVNVHPQAKGWNSPRAAMFSYNKTKLATPRNIRVIGNEIKWDEVKDATSYEIKIDGEDYTSSKASYEISFDITSGKEYTLSIRAIGEDNSSWSDKIIVGDSLSDSLSYWRNTVSWNHVVGATSYEVAVNGTKQIDEIPAGLNNAKIKLTKARENNITVTAFYSDQSYSSASLEVYANTIRFNSTGGEDVDAIYLASGDMVNLPTAHKPGYKLNSWYTSWDGGTIYNSEYSDTYYIEQGNITLHASWSPDMIGASFIYGDGTGTETSKEILFGSDFKLTVPTIDDGRVFGGWYTQDDGEGRQLTDEVGVGIGTWDLTEETELYAFWATALEYSVIEHDGDQVGWLAKRGEQVHRLTYLEIPHMVYGFPVIEIDSYAFDSCVNLKRIEFHKDIRYISNHAFVGCINLSEIIIDPNNKAYKMEDGALFEIGENETNERVLLLYTPGLIGEYTIPSDIIQVGPYVFAGATGLEKIIIHKDVSTINHSAFKRCASLKEVVFEEGIQLKTLEKHLFSECVSLKSVTIPSSVTLLEIGVFHGCVLLEEVNFEDGEEELLMKSPSVYTNDPSAFKDCWSLKTLEIPARMTTISDYAFHGCTSLETVTFAENGSIETIGSYAFRYSGITNITIPSSLTVLSNNAFEGCESLLTVEFKEDSKVKYLGTTAYNGNVFTDCINLQTVTFGSGSALIAINKESFLNCTSLASIEFKKTKTNEEIKIETIGASAFKNCTNLTGIELPSTVELIEEFAFENCTALPSINIPAGITNLSYKAFLNCGALFKVHADNERYSSDTDGSPLFNKNKTSIHMYADKAGTSYSIPKTVETIEEGAFYQKQLESISIPSSVKSIDNEAFSNCTSLTLITFDDGDEGLIIRNQAFQDCIALKSITFPKRLKEISEFSFKGCINLNEVDFGLDSDLNGTLGKNSFEGCVSLTEILIPAGVTTLAEASFLDCVNLTKVTLEEGTLLNSIGIGAFKNTSLEHFNIEATTKLEQLFDFAFENTKIRSINIPDSVITLGNGLFTNCTLLLEVNIGTNSKMKYMRGAVFNGCSNIRNIFIPKLVTSLSASTFTGCISLVNVDVHSENVSLKNSQGGVVITGTTLTYYPTGRAGAYEIPSTVISVGASAFAGNKVLSSITFGNPAANVKIDKSAFEGCTALAVVSLPQGTVNKSIGIDAFKDCTALSRIVIPSNYNSIGNTAFLGCLNLREITVNSENTFYSSVSGVLFNKNFTTLHTYPAGRPGEFQIPNTVTTWNASAFAYSSYLQKVTFEAGSNFKRISLKAFEYSGLTSIELPESLTTISNEAFLYSQLESVVMPKSITRINTSSFGYCANLKSVTLPEAISRIGASAFKGSGLEELIIPSSVTEISSMAFQDCINLTTLTLSPLQDTSLSIKNEAFKGCFSLLKLKFPAGASYSFGNNAFEDCTSLEKVEMEGNVASTSNFMFKNCVSLKKVVLSDQITTIGANAFEGCESLEEIHLSDNLEMIRDSAFAGCSSLQSITIPYKTRLLSSVFEGWTPNQIINVKGRFAPHENWNVDWDAGCKATKVWGV